ncbi:MAG TPA: signal peptide peptidase SppA [Candidatus Binataceae bacterium]|nr:signal peptide peptidase SppA [Candidatus Binataceae bacterium]
MKLETLKKLIPGPSARVAIIAAVLAALGLLAIHLDAPRSGVALLLIAVAIVAAYLGLVVRPARMPRDATLTIHLEGSLREYAPRSLIDQLRGRSFPTLDDVRTALEAAARDPGLRAVIVELGALNIGLATAQELHDLLAAVKRAGKRVVAVMAGDQASVREYLVAAGASKIVVNPDTALMLLGVAAGNLFLKLALDKAQIEAQTLQWKEYKGAAEMFSRETMSPPLRESLEAIVGDWEAILVETIAADRGLAPDRARELVGAGFLSARAACEAGLADSAGYGEDVRAELEPERGDKAMVGLVRYLRHAAFKLRSRQAHRIALIHGLGPVVVGEPPPSGDFMSGEATAAAIRDASIDPTIRAIVFRVNSPGGSAVGSDLIWRAVKQARERGKPVVVSMGDVAGSGGYYVAMGADAIVAEPGTVTGSIGVVYTKFNVGKLMSTLGINVDFAKTREVSDALSPTRAMSAAELGQLNALVGELYGNFTAKVAEGRGIKPEQAEELARGRIWSGRAARERGLVDELGGLARAVEIARTRAGIAADESHVLVAMPPAPMLFGMKLVLMPAEVPWEISALAESLGIPGRWSPAMLRLLWRGGAMLMCPWLGG